MKKNIYTNYVEQSHSRIYNMFTLWLRITISPVVKNSKTILYPRASPFLVSVVHKGFQLDL
jgi:hypothetical protein